MRGYRAEPDPFPPLSSPSAPAPTARSPEPDDASAPEPVRVVAAARTDCGRERAENQDRAVIADAATDQVWTPPAVLSANALPSGAFFTLVCDGMGGEAGGSVASTIAIETIVGAMTARWHLRDAVPGSGAAPGEARVAQALTASFEAASARIRQAGRDEPVYSRMGTTATLATLVDGVLLCAQIGDSRGYVLRGARLVQVTEDQTMAELLRRSGNLAPQQIAEIVGPNVILQALGCSSRLEVALSRTPLAHGDVVLLCSDGLFGVVSDAEIAEELRGASDLSVACDRLVALANDRGGPDNITCAAFGVAGGGLLDPESPLEPVLLTPPLGFR